MRREWTRAEELRAAEFRRSGLKLSAVARRLDRPLPSVRSKLSRLGVVVDPFSAPGRKPGLLRRAVKRLWRPGVTDVELADRLNVEPSAVRVARRKLGLRAATPAESQSAAAVWRRKVKPGVVAELAAAGKSNAEIARELRVTRQAVWKVRKALTRRQASC